MPIAQADLQNYARRSGGQTVIIKRASQRTAFLCHSHHDRELALGLQAFLREQGLDLYIDWQDSSMPSQPNADTANKLRQRIVGSEWFLFLATQNSMASRWCPWELGYADGKKPLDKIAIVPTRDGHGTHGNEYLQLYRRIEVDAHGGLGIFGPNATQGYKVNSI
ncbi:toll/interleukin-1 receptor domain-containing protein [Comamonas aquatica]|uniref:Toll/interleukin-1 receptor domain-containing protein n=1 Tax=Comamonas aquatica TaxID=225991 RepID=A0AA42W4K3_9BURK|nr:toll/interleukin-1 receptor domain-containing protein [Comamonas aquatica]MDH1428882.1 toll/interleukin-1 receptor domain-containing protein [Comamonas aquatica]MDH1606601.1 toll/interleukin-1 receptor domain-containing protein [Comamonas aquatica]MDH1618345.1 toll/interleukin-1 receptor domain-containing protein [Comamonas aquatica]MDH2006428.1 toll/interleukin-1 receptor domain-containing protein [Comamonas aquatica]